MFQVNAGQGVARYINDLNSAGGQDAVFTPDGELRTLRVCVLRRLRARLGNRKRGSGSR